jgi:hypothetical protein
MMNCTEYGKYLKKLESGEADRSDLEIMRKHEQQCPKCAPIIIPAAIQKNSKSGHSFGQFSRLYIFSLTAQQAYRPIAHNRPYQRIPPSPK